MDRKKILLIVGSIVGLFLIVFPMFNKPQPKKVITKPKEEKVVRSTKHYPAKKKELAGGYVYHEAEYTEGERIQGDAVYIESPKEKQPETMDDVANKLRDSIKAELPNIQAGQITIPVQHPENVTVEVYKGPSNYFAILNYNGYPFGYIQTFGESRQGFTTDYYYRDVKVADIQ